MRIARLGARGHLGYAKNTPFVTLKNTPSEKYFNFTGVYTEFTNIFSGISIGRNNSLLNISRGKYFILIEFYT